MAYITCSSEDLGRQDIRHTLLCPPLCAHRLHRSHGRMTAFLIMSLQRTATQIFHWRTQPAGRSDLSEHDCSPYYSSWLWLWSLTCVSSWSMFHLLFFIWIVSIWITVFPEFPYYNIMYYFIFADYSVQLLAMYYMFLFSHIFIHTDTFWLLVVYCCQVGVRPGL